MSRNAFRYFKSSPGARHDQSWTAWPEHFNFNLAPSGFLRLTLDAWGYSGQTFVESENCEEVVEKRMAAYGMLDSALRVAVEVA